MSNTNNIPNEIIAGAIKALDKANNPHMKSLQADLVHDLRGLMIQQQTEKETGVYLPFCPRLQVEVSMGEIVARHHKELINR